MFASELFVDIFCRTMNDEKQVEPWRSQCPVARTLDLIGDRWSLLIVRDMLLGSSKFQQFLADWGESSLPKSRGQRRTSSTQA
jgi:hypothetical protein